MSIKARDKEGKPKYAIEASNFDRQDFKEVPPPAKWEPVPITHNAKLLFTQATRNTGFTIEGELVCILQFKDGRRIRLYPKDFNYRESTKLFRTIRMHFACKIPHDP